MKKILSMILTVCMLISVLPTSFVWAASEPVVLFDYDFEDCKIGENVSTKKDSLTDWSAAVYTDVARIEAENDAEHGTVAKYHRTTGSGGPYIEKVLYTEGMTNMMVSFEAKQSGGSSLKFSLRYADGTSDAIQSVSATAWTKVEVKFDFINGTYSVDNGLPKTMKSQDISVLTLRFAATVSTQKWAYLDDVLVTTTDDVNPEEISNGGVGERTTEEIMAPFAQYTKAPENTVPDGKYKLFAYDGSLNKKDSISTGTNALWTSVSKAKPAVLDGDNLIRFTNDKRVAQEAYATKKLAVGTTPGTVCMTYYTVLSDSKAYVTLTANKDTVTTALVETTAITASTDGVSAAAWNLVKAEFDFTNQQYKIYINSTLAEQGAFKASMPEGAYEVTIGACAKLAGADTMLVDNFVMYQDSEPEVSGKKYYGTTGTTWGKVTEDVVLDESSYVSKLRSHPRLLITNRQAVLDKIANDPKVAAWYQAVKEDADNDLGKDPQKYEFSNGRNIKKEASVISGRITRWALVYLVEHDEQYFNRALLEIRNAGTFPDWSNSAPILASGIMYSIACFYDWCYDSPNMTDAVKTEIIDIVKNQALWQFARSYDGVLDAEIANGTTNRTTVANACGAGMAIAMADEEPELAQYLIDNAIEHIKQTVEAYSTDGAFAEGTSYWEYANNSMFNFLAQMDSATVEGYEKPETLQWYYDSDILLKTPDYWAYMSGPAGNFDYGDSNPAFSKHPLIYWYSQRNNKPFYSWFLERTLQRTGSSVGSKSFAISYYDNAFESYNDGSMPLDKTFNATDLAQVASMRSSWTAGDALYAAIQGGDNQASHMAKSLGTFVLDANGKRFVRQIGHVDYGALYDSRRYYMERAEGNNTIIANPNLDGESFDQNENAVARFIAHAEAKNEAFTVLDMTETNDAFTDAKRGLYMTKGRNSVVLQDEITTNKPSEIWWFAHTDAELTLTDGGKGAIMRIDNEKMYAKITSGPADAVFTVMPAESMMDEALRAPDEVKVNCQKLAIHMQNVSNLTLTVEFIPLRAGEGVPNIFTEVKPIAQWSVTDNTIPAKRQAGDAVVMLANSPMAIAYESKVVIDEKDTTVAPFVQDGTLYVPAIRTAKLAYGTAELASGTVLKVTRDYKTNTIALSDLLEVDGTYYVPATAMATALGMQLYTYENEMFAFADRAPAYTEAEKAAVYTELNTNVYLNGELFTGFSTEKTTYSIQNDIAMPTVRVSSDALVTRTKDSASFTVNGQTYNLYRTDVINAAARYNIALGKVMTANRTMGETNKVENITDGDMGTFGGVKYPTVTNVTFTLDLGGPHYIERFELTDRRPEAASVMEEVVYYGILEDGSEVELGKGDLTTGTVSGIQRFNGTECTLAQPVTAIKMYLKDTDDSINDESQDRIYIYEFEIIGFKKSVGPLVPETKTTYVKQDGGYAFSTEIVGPAPQSGYLIAVAYNGDKQVGMRIVPCTGKEKEEYTMECAAIDKVQIMLLESFFTMRLLANPEIL